MRDNAVFVSGVQINPMLDDRIDGLLLLVEVGLTMSAGATAWQLWKDFPLLIRSINLFVAILGSGSIVAPIAMGMTAATLASRFFFLAFSVDLAVLLWRKDRLFPRFLVRYLVANAIILGLSAMIYVPLSLVLQFDASEAVFGALASFGICIVWIPYFRKSPRVKETFVR